MTLAPLPIDAVIPQLLAAVERCGAVVLTAPPGSGKTTRVPAALVDHGLDGEVWVLQPRRLAARAAARRVAFERNGRVGDEVGYQVRHDRQTSSGTRIRFVTEGVLLRKLLHDPFLPDVAAIVLDEFHERSLEADLTLAMLAEVRNTVREDLTVLVMSATLDPSPIVAFLEPCESVTAEGRLHDVHVEHVPVARAMGREDLPQSVRSAVSTALDATTGDVLVFLPGVGEIQRSLSALEDSSRRAGVAVLPLHGQLSPREQDAAIVRGSSRKIVLATNVAETSITIEGVTAVVDSGLVRILRHDVGRGLDRLELQRISRASAEQRRGRAGRTGPGVCYRLWSVAEDRGLAPFEVPEIRRLDLAGVALQVRSFAARDPREFGWFEAPGAMALDLADDLLGMLGAVDARGITDVGKAMLRHPLHPRLARMMEEGSRRGCPHAAAEFAALLSERDLLSRRGDGRHREKPADLFALRSTLLELEDAGFSNATARSLGVDVRAARAVAKARDQIARGAEADREGITQDDLTKTLLAGYPDRVSKRTSEHETEGVMATGRGFRLTMRDHEDLGELLLALQVRESGDRTQSRSLVDLACPLREDWLDDVFPGAIRDEETADFHGVRGTVTAVRRRWFGRLVLEERTGGRVDPDRVHDLLAAQLREDPWRYLGAQKDLRAFLCRLAWLREQLPEGNFPAITDSDIADAAVSLSAGMTRLSAIADVPVLDVLIHGLDREVQARLRTHAPERVTLPSGRQARIDYDSGPEPFVAARLQEFFGLRETPSLAGGRVPLLLHLLAPNHRPVQITRDLASFWANVYPGVRSELRRRYPKHAWPEDPIAAQPESRPRRRR